LRIFFKNSGVKRKMPKTPRDPENTAPKKRTRKATTEVSDATKVVKAAVTTMKTKEVPVTVSVEERIRARAYELYLRRGGNGGSPEQDWFQATAEVCNESVA
jgi:hypothetical protein